MPRADLTGVLLVGGRSSRFGSPKVNAVFRGETLAVRGWRTLGEACEHRLAVGKTSDGQMLPFTVFDDGTQVRAPIKGIIAALRAAPTELSVILPVDCPLVTAEMLLELADACKDVAHFQAGPLPGAYRRSALSALESPELAIKRAIASLDVVVVHADPAQLANINTPADLAVLE